MIIPELGPLLGTLVEPADSGAEDAGLDAVRLSMVSRLFEQAGTARRLLETGEETAARSALGPSIWIRIWEEAAERSASVLSEHIDRDIRQSAAFSRYPRSRLQQTLPSEEDRRILAARLSAAGIGIETAAPLLDSTGAEWQEAERRLAGELEQAWQRLARTADQELASWGAKSRTIRAWRRPWWPLLLGGGAALALSTWVGLLLGGFIPVPEPLRPAAEWVWSLRWP